MHTEVELKWALDAPDYARLCIHLGAALGPPELLEQDNRFFDSADGRLRRAGLSVRLRRENGRVVLTCKGRGRMSDDGTGTHRREEWERELPPAAWDAPPRDLPPAWAAALGDGALVCLGGFRNLRRQWQDRPHVLCLDDTDFGDRHEYELEIETPEPAAAYQRWTERLAAWGISWRPQPHTKLRRWLAFTG